MEETTSTGGSATPTPATTATVTPASASAMQQTAAPTHEDVLRELEELKHKHSNATEELERHRKFRSAYDKKAAEEQAAKEAAEKAQLSEIERATRERDEALKTRMELEKQLRETKTNHAIVLEATAQKFIRPAIVARLIEPAEIEYNEAGEPTNIDKLLAKLKKSMPELVHSDPEPTQQTSTQSAPTNQPANAAPKIPPMAPGRANIPAPGSLPPGTIPRLADLRRRP